MLRFQHILHLLALGVIPLLILFFILKVLWGRKKLKKLGDEYLIVQQIRGYIQGRSTSRFILLTIALACLIIGWANLQMGAKTDKVQRKGVDVIIALDVSKSMLAKDIQPDRLARAKQLIMHMLDKMTNDRVALIVFAGRSYLQVPLTIDYSAMKMMMQTVKPDMVPTQGTVIGEAIDLSLRSFSQKERKYKSLVIISDGEDHDEETIKKAKEASESGVVIHTIGIGSPQGTTIYDPETKSMKLDENGDPVVSKLNEDELKSIAGAGKGTYTLLNNTEDAAGRLIEEIDGMEQKSLGAVIFTDYKSYFQYFLLAGLVLIMIEWFLPGANQKAKTRAI
ncbi:MAG: VWA domain-containing protein [Sphingobacteriales bacterium]|nr:MAG: VWA domain-containing protein [Sphingobacteriales bacterium]